MPGTRKLGRATDSRKAMLRAMVTYLFENGKIETTVARAKEVRSMAEKMVTLGKREDLHAKRQIFSFITKEDVAKKVIDEIGPKYADRSGGYTRIIKTGMRRGDAAEMAIIEVVVPAACSGNEQTFGMPLPELDPVRAAHFSGRRFLLCGARARSAQKSLLCPCLCGDETEN
mgnify:CR=1 FL=1